MTAQQGAQAVAQAERGAVGAENIFPGLGLKARETETAARGQGYGSLEILPKMVVKTP